MSSIQRSGKVMQQKTLGQTLRAAREDKQLSIHDITQRLLLNKQIIIDIENDDYSRIPAKVYAEGYLRAYANLLHLSMDDVLRDFRNLGLYREVYPEITPSAERSCSCCGNCFIKYGATLLGLMKQLPRRLVLVGGLGLAVLLLLIGIMIFCLKGCFQRTAATADHGGTDDNVVVVQDLSGDGDPRHLESILVTKSLSAKGQRDGKDTGLSNP